MELTSDIQPPYESCTDSTLPQGFVDPPERFVEPVYEFRLIEPLRWAAATRDPRKILAYAAAAFHRAQHPTSTSSAQQDTELGNALADLSVTGRVAYTQFRDLQPIEAAVTEYITTGLLAFMADSIPAGVIISGLLASLPPQWVPTQVASAVGLALDRAYAVAWALRGPVAQTAGLRAPIGWIAVSGEDDKPGRPVNVPSPPFEQYEIPVTVAGVTVQTRFLIASPPGGAPPAGPVPTTRAFPSDPEPHIPEGNQVILFLHGHSSGAEEALTIIPHIHMAGLQQNKKFSIISFDLPNNGYSESFDHESVALSSETSFPGGILDHGQVHTPVLDYIEDFIVAFVDALNLITPIKSRFSGVIGGSLGGNMGLRLGRRDLVASPWLDAGIVSWSPASVWDPMIQDELKRHAPEHCRDNWTLDEADNTRSNYFYEVFEKNALDVIVPYTQPQMWYREGWEPCKALHIKGARIARREIYNEQFRQWHWRVAGEQLIYSHVDLVDHEDNTSPVRYKLNKVKQLLIAGKMDNFTGSNIFDATRNLAGFMKDTPGRSLFLRATGHSVHFERPAFLAKQIVDFLPVKRPALELPPVPLTMQITCTYREQVLSVGRKGRTGPPKLGRILSVGGINLTQDLPFQLTVTECISYIDHGSKFFVLNADGKRIAVQVVRKTGSRPYIATVHDTSAANNLLSLPEC